MSAKLWRPKKEGGRELLYHSEKTGSQLVWRPDPLGTRGSRESEHPAEWTLRPPIEQLQLGIRRVRDKMLEWEHGMSPQAPGWVAKKNGKETQLWPIEWGSICCSSVRSPTPSHTQPFQIKWVVYFSKKKCVARLYGVEYTTRDIDLSLLVDQQKVLHLSTFYWHWMRSIEPTGSDGR